MTALTLNISINPVVAYFILYSALTLYVVENWAFNRELSSNLNQEKMQTLLSKIENLTFKVHVLEKLLAVKTGIADKKFRINQHGSF